MVNGILAIVSHPDDETFGCGGTLALHSSMRYDVTVLCLTCDPFERRKEFIYATQELGISDTLILDYKNVNVDDELIKLVSSIIVDRKPSIVISHLHFDYHKDHRATYDVVKEAIEWAGHTTTYNDAWVVEKLLLMEINTLIPVPHIIVDISSVFENKMKAVEAYPTQLAKFDWDYYQKQNKKKAEFRGVQGDCEYAEAFLIEPTAQNGPFFPQKSTANLL